MTMKRNQVIITALVVMIAVAGYLNYVDAKKTNTKTKVALTDTGEISALVPFDEEGMLTDNLLYTPAVEIGEALTMEDSGNMIMTDMTEMADVTDMQATAADQTTSPDAGEAVFVNTISSSSYFVQAKLEREQARSKQKDILMGLINDTKIDQEQRAMCADAMLEIQKRIEKETAAEAMIEAKGFKEVYVRIDDNTVDVVVNKDALSDAEIAQIEDIVKRKTGMNPEQIRISAIKKQ